eukprot:4268852-Alexandrium_andersonii.AAC.1
MPGASPASTALRLMRTSNAPAPRPAPLATSPGRIVLTGATACDTACVAGLPSETAGITLLSRPPSPSL